MPDSSADRAVSVVLMIVLVLVISVVPLGRQRFTLRDQRTAITIKSTITSTSADHEF